MTEHEAYEITRMDGRGHDKQPPTEKTKSYREVSWCPSHTKALVWHSVSPREVCSRTLGTDHPEGSGDRKLEEWSAPLETKTRD